MGEWESEKWRFRLGNRYNTLRLHAFWVWKPLWVLAWNRQRSFQFLPLGVNLPSGKHCIKKQASQYSRYACYWFEYPTKYCFSFRHGPRTRCWAEDQRVRCRARTISTALVLVGGFKSDLRDIISTALVLVISASSCIMFYTFITIASGMQGVLVSTPPLLHLPHTYLSGALAWGWGFVLAGLWRLEIVSLTYLISD